MPPIVPTKRFSLLPRASTRQRRTLTRWPKGPHRVRLAPLVMPVDPLKFCLSNPWASLRSWKSILWAPRRSLSDPLRRRLRKTNRAKILGSRDPRPSSWGCAPSIASANIAVTFVWKRATWPINVPSHARTNGKQLFRPGTRLVRPLEAGARVPR